MKTSNLEKMTTFMGLVGQVATYVQAYKIFELKSAHAISLIAVLITFTSMVFWLVYGLKQHVKPLVICNIVGLIGTSLVLAGVLFYESNLF